MASSTKNTFRHPLFLSLIGTSDTNEDSEGRFLVFGSRKLVNTSSFLVRLSDRSFGHFDNTRITSGGEFDI
jgi:hypothetical protein